MEASHSKYLAKFGGHSPCYSRDIIDPVFHVTLQEHVIKGLCEFLKQSSLLYIPTLPSLVGIGIVVVDI